MTYDGSHAYFYDAEDRLIQVDGTLGNCSTATVCYLYDAQGHRVRRSWPAGGGIRNTDYIVGADGRVHSEWNNGADWGAGFWGEGYAYLGGQQLAHYHNGTTLFVHPDHLGSTRIQTDLSQNVQVSYDYLPFGETLQSGSGNWHQFTGNERDPADNLDRTQFRQYSSQFGRWMHPDPAGLAAVDPANPQSWNRYTYVSNRPTYWVDPSGLCDVIVGGFTQTPGTAATDTQQFLASEIGADQAYPYSGLNFAQSSVAAYDSVSPLVAADAIVDAADQSGGQPFTIYAFSGGAQAVANAWPSLPQSVQNQATVVYISPGHVPLGNSLPPGITFQGQGPLDSLVTSLSPNGSLTECGHNANCEFGALSDIIRNGNPYGGRFPQACKVPSVFTRQNIVGGGGGGGAGGSGGGGASGSWDYPSNNPFGNVDQGGGGVTVVCSYIGGVPSGCTIKSVY